jgi:glycosyltransferase 2 family protein
MKGGRNLLPAILTLAGFLLLTAVVIRLGAAQTLHAVASVSLAGFGAYLGAQMLLLFGLAFCWRQLLRSRKKGHFGVLYWARMVRDAAGEFLPFSHVGGFVLGARAVTLTGVTMSDAAASTLADLTTEFLAEIAFIAIGLVLLAGLAPHSTLLAPVSIGLALAIVASVGLVWVQKGGSRLFRLLAMRIAGPAAEGAALRMDLVQISIDETYARRDRLAIATGAHFVCWLGTGVISWIGFHALGVNISLGAAFSIEALLHAILALSFLVPGRVGVQEATYALLATIYGVPPDMALSLSLLRRARDLVIAVPVLLSWQALEARRLARKPSESRIPE